MLKSITIFKFLILCIFLLNESYAQTFTDAGSYMNFIGTQNRDITADFWSYTSAVAHGKSARKIENRRATLIKTVKESIAKINALAPYKGDKSLKDSSLAYLNLTYNILNDDYSKILDMEAVSEQSYDAMEAYLLAQELAGEKQEKAAARLNNYQLEFAKKYNVNIVESNNDELYKKVKEAGLVSDYNRVVYLIFFKAYKQEAYLLDALNKKNIASIEQNKKSLLQYSEEGIKKLDTMKAFKGDRSVVIACKQMLDFYKNECNNKFSIFTNHFLTVESFEKTKKAFENKKQSDRTQADVDQYNNGVKTLNASVNSYNQTNNELNQNRSNLIDNYNKSSQNFLDKHTPKYR